VEICDELKVVVIPKKDNRERLEAEQIDVCEV
jgi:hypothetical protein